MAFFKNVNHVEVFSLKRAHFLTLSFLSSPVSSGWNFFNNNEKKIIKERRD
ncbi:hypothetical protein LguiA_002778 [Lonicera macranthoides]